MKPGHFGDCVFVSCAEETVFSKRWWGDNVLVFSGCYSKNAIFRVPYKQQYFFSYNSRDWEIKDKGANKFHEQRGPLSMVHSLHLLTVSSQDIKSNQTRSLGLWRETESECFCPLVQCLNAYSRWRWSKKPGTQSRPPRNGSKNSITWAITTASQGLHCQETEVRGWERRIEPRSSSVELLNPYVKSSLPRSCFIRALIPWIAVLLHGLKIPKVSVL